MVRQPSKPRQIAISDRLWNVYEVMASDSGFETDDLINQAMFDMAVRLGYVSPVSQGAQAPIEEKIPQAPQRPTIPAPESYAGEGRFAAGRTKEAVGRKAPPAPTRPPAPAPAPSPSRPAMAAAPRAERAVLYVIGEESGTEKKVDKDIFIIGRSSKCDLVINSVKVSREHAIITRERGEYFIEDLGSANGTWYKGEKIEKMKIKDGDEIFICDEKFKFVLR